MIRAGDAELVVTGGMESMSNAPYALAKARFGYKLGDGSLIDLVTHDGLVSSFDGRHMVEQASFVARELGVSREEQDAWAFRSHQRAIAAIDAGAFVDEIVPLKIKGLDDALVEFSVDEHPRRETSLEKLASLKVLHPEIEGFSITAGNSSGTNDAAAALTLAEQDFARSAGLKVLGSVKAWASAAVEPKDTGLGAVKVIGKVLDRAGLSPGDVTLWEINEAFASVPIAACREYGLDEDLVNIYGSGCSLGHPIAASGARMLTTLVHELGRRGGGIGVAAMCAGGGQGGAVVIEV